MLYLYLLPRYAVVVVLALSFPASCRLLPLGLHNCFLTDYPGVYLLISGSDSGAFMRYSQIASSLLYNRRSNSEFAQKEIFYKMHETFAMCLANKEKQDWRIKTSRIWASFVAFRMREDDPISLIANIHDERHFSIAAPVHLRRK